MGKASHIPIGELVLQIVASLRNIDGRIIELVDGIQNNFYNEAGIAWAKDRVTKLTQTKYELVCSLQDTRLGLNRMLGANLDLANTYMQNNYLHGTVA